MNRFTRRSTVRWKNLLPLLALLLGGAVLLTTTQVRVQTAYYKQQIRAAERMAEAFPILSAQAKSLGIPLDLGNDPNRTGLIGPKFSEITTTVGSLSAKRTTTNPDFAALLVRLLHELELEIGARVVLALSGSFPALGIAAIIACQELGLELLILSSVGASSFGANHPEMTWLDMEALLYQHNIIRYRTTFASLGGVNDLGKSFFGDGKALALAAIERSGLTPVAMATPAEQWQRRLEQVRTFQPHALINVGGNQLNIGQSGHLLPPGIITATSLDSAQLGIIGWFLNHNLPVIHLLRVQDLALRFDLPLDPIPLPSPGESAVYYRTRVHIGWAIMTMALICLYVLFLILSNFKWHCRILI